MADERLYQFPSKASPVPADIIYVGDSADAFDEVQSTIAQIISAYPNLSNLGGLTLGANTYAYVNNSSVWTAGSISALAVSLLADTSTGTMQSTLGLVVGTDVEAHSAALDSIAGLTTAANELIYTTASNTYAVIASAASSVLVTDSSSVPSLSQTLPSAVQANITLLGTQSQALNMGSHLINNVTDPVSAQDAATKNYIDTQIANFASVFVARLASTTALTVTYSNGTAGVGATLTNAGAQAAFALDGVSAALNDLVLIKNQASTFQNGYYKVTTLGSGASNWVLTRSTEYDQPSEINPGDIFVITAGSTQANTSWIETATVTTIGTDPITFTQYSVALPIAVSSGGTGLTSLTAYALLAGGTTSTGNIQQVATGSAGQVLQSNGSSALPSFSTATYPSTAGTSGTLLRSNGTNFVNTTATYPTTATGTGTILRADGTNWTPTTATFPATAGTAGNSLVSDGTNWSSAPRIGKVVIQAFNASGTYTPTSGMAYCIIECVGGGGAGGGAAAAGAGAGTGGGGGGGGGYSRIVASAATIGASQTVTVGAGGTAGTAGNNAGNNGGDTSVGTICIGKGGTGGSGSAGAPGGAGGAGGVAGTGTVITIGGIGSNGVYAGVVSVVPQGGRGGDTFFGSGAPATVNNAAATGNNATLPGGGGSGGITYNNSGSVSGGAGGLGYVVITEFISAS